VDDDVSAAWAQPLISNGSALRLFSQNVHFHSAFHRNETGA
jgi:hypothetical protein